MSPRKANSYEVMVTRKIDRFQHGRRNSACVLRWGFGKSKQIWALEKIRRGEGGQTASTQKSG